MKKTVTVILAMVICILAFYSAVVLLPSNQDKNPILASNILRAGTVIDGTGDKNGLGEEIIGTPYVDGEEVGYIKETGQLVTKAGLLIRIPSDASSAHFFDTGNSLVDSANRKMQIYYDSVSLQHTLRSNDKNLVSIKNTDEVYMTSILDPNDNRKKTVYTTIKKVQNSFGKKMQFWNPKNFATDYRYEYYDMNGRQIPESWFIEHDQMPWYKATATRFVGFFESFFGGGAKPVEWVKCESVGTYAELREELKVATWHPYGVVENAVTEIGRETIYVNPKNDQLMSYYYEPLFDISNGEPIIIYEDRIITIPSMKEVKISPDGELVNAVSRDYIRNSGLYDFGEEYVHFTEFNGVTYDCIVWLNGDTWQKVNGEEADFVIDGWGVTKDDKNQSIFTTVGSVFKNTGKAIKNIFSGVGTFFDWVVIIFWIVVAVVIIVVIMLIVNLCRRKTK